MSNVKKGHMTPDMIFDEFPDLETNYSWDSNLIRNFIKGGALAGYYDTTHREPVVLRASLLECIRSINKINRMRQIDLGQLDDYQQSTG